VLFDKEASACRADEIDTAEPAMQGFAPLARLGRMADADDRTLILLGQAA
jgi:hypothetical protein